MKQLNVDLPKLQYIQLDTYALRGKIDDESCSLIMRSMNEIE